MSFGKMKAFITIVEKQFTQDDHRGGRDSHLADGADGLQGRYHGDYVQRDKAQRGKWAEFKNTEEIIPYGI